MCDDEIKKTFRPRIYDKTANEIVKYFLAIFDKRNINSLLKEEEAETIRKYLVALYEFPDEYDVFLNDLTLMQQEIISGFGEPTEQNKDDRYHSAKRFIAYLIADSMIEYCVNCEDNSLKSQFYCDEFLPYLQSLSLHEFVAFKAYFQWLNDKDGLSDVFDYWDWKKYYYTELDEFRNICAKIGAKFDSNSIQCLECLNFFIKDNNLDEAFSNPQKIKKAKINTLVRLNEITDYDIALRKDIDNFISMFYYGAFSSDRTKLKNDINEYILHSIVAQQIKFLRSDDSKSRLSLHPRIPNMIEFFLS